MLKLKLTAMILASLLGGGHHNAGHHYGWYKQYAYACISAYRLDQDGTVHVSPMTCYLYPLKNRR